MGDSVMRALAAAAAAMLLAACQSKVGPSLDGTPTKWPHEPAGFVTITDQPWNELVSDGWNRRDSRRDRIVTDQSAPLSPSGALEYVYPAGFRGGTAPATHYYPLDGAKELFIGLQWRVSDPWQGHESGVNKIQFVYGPRTDVAMVMYGQKGGPYEVRVMPQWPEHDGSWLTSNVKRAAITPGRWHRLEWYLKYESRYGAGDGVIRWWVDGDLAGDHTAARFPNDAGFGEYQMSPTWGGVGDVKTQTDYYRFDHSYISSPSSTAARGHRQIRAAS